MRVGGYAGEAIEATLDAVDVPGGNMVHKAARELEA